MKIKLLVLAGAVLLGTLSVQAQMGSQLALLHSPAYEGAAAPLRSAPARQYNFSKAVLSDVMRLMAEDAGIGFFGLPDGSDGGDRLVTFTINASPFVALETLAKANGVALIYDGGIWYLRPANDQELIGRIYEINYNAQEVVTKNSQGGGASGGMGGAGGGATGAGTASTGLNLQGSPDFFVTEPSRILEDIQNILDIPTTGSMASFAPTASVDTVTQMSLGGMAGVPNLASHQAPAASGNDGGGQSKVIWNSDSNTLYVVATRQQHQWIEAYLASADRPQPMIAVEVKFVETSRDPSSNLGIDWDGALGENGLQVNLRDNSGPINLNSVGGYSLPTAVLSYSDLNLKLRSIYNDRNTKSVSFPRMVTLDNREVSFRSVINQPVLGSSASASLGAGATQTSSVEYLPIGTVINILPKRMAGDQILLNVSVTVSDIVGTELIDGNPFPIATSRVYTAPLTVKSGYTVAISGLDAARSEDSERGVPILGKLPVLGYAFKNKRQDRSRQHLMMLITPIALNSGTEGLTEKPVIREPWKQAAPVQAYPEAKAPAYDGKPRTNADLPNHHIRDIPEFREETSVRKSEQTFGKKDALVAEPVPVRTTQRQISGGEASAMGSSSEIPGMEILPRPQPDALNTPMIVETPVVPTDAAADSRRSPDGETGSRVGAPVTEELGPQRATVATVGTSEGDAAEETASDSRPKPTPEVSGEDASQLAEFRDGVAEIRAWLSSVPAGEDRLSPDDAQLVLNAHELAAKLIERIDEVRNDRSQPLGGELGEAWWDLISLKSRAAKLSERSPSSLALSGQ